MFSVKRIASKFNVVSHTALLVYCASAALSIAVHQTAVVVAILSWILYRANPPQDSDSRTTSHPFAIIAYPILCWVVISYISTFIGVNPERAVPEILKSSFYVLFPFCVYDALLSAGTNVQAVKNRIQQYLVALFCGQSVAALHSVLSEAYGQQLPPRIPGAVTESGQLALILPLVAVLLVSHRRRETKERGFYFIQTLTLVFMTILAAVLASWPQILRISRGDATHIAFIGLFVGTLLLLFQDRNSKDPALQDRTLLSRFRFLSVSLVERKLWGLSAVLFSAFVVNLKRGPWVAVFVQLVIIGALYSRRLLIAVVALAVTMLVVIEPVRTRTEQFIADFSITGGRQNMWALGIELAEQYPLGLGPDNAAFMRQVDPTLPPLHRHMHNNLLNVAVESGWIGLAAYCWWMLAAIGLAFSVWARSRQMPHATEDDRSLGTIAFGCGLALLGWQIAGSVEYNFGDGEIRVLAFFLMGVTLVCARLLAIDQLDVRGIASCFIRKYDRARNCSQNLSHVSTSPFSTSTARLHAERHAFTLHIAEPKRRQH